MFSSISVSWFRLLQFTISPPNSKRIVYCRWIIICTISLVHTEIDQPTMINISFTYKMYIIMKSIAANTHHTKSICMCSAISINSYRSHENKREWNECFLPHTYQSCFVKAENKLCSRISNCSLANNKLIPVSVYLCSYITYSIRNNEKYLFTSLSLFVFWSWARCEQIIFNEFTTNGRVIQTEQNLYVCIIYRKCY